MEIVGRPPSEAEPELHLLTDWGDAKGGPLRREAGILSIVAHAALIVALLLLPSELFETPSAPEPVRHITPLIDPLTALTQKEPNPGKVRKEFDGSESRPRPRLQAPPSPPPAPKPEPPRMAVATPPPTPRTAPPPLPPEPIKTELPKEVPKEPPKLELPQQQPVTPPPQIQAEEKPKSPFERPAGPPIAPPPTQRRVAIPDTAAVIHGGVPGGLSGSSGVTLPSTQAGPGGELELPQLLSDVQGVDFRPYLTRLLFTVKRNWMSVWPESAKGGRRGKVAIQFSIARDGTVQKVVFASQSGTDALDRAAVAAISMSTPFAPLPSEFRGDRVVLQFNFAYNMPKQ